MRYLPKVEDLLQLNILPYHIDFIDWELCGELARRSIEKFENFVKLARCINHICYVNIDCLFKSRCSTCYTFSSKIVNLERNLVTCSDRVKPSPKECLRAWRNSLWYFRCIQDSLERGADVFWTKLAVLIFNRSVSRKKRTRRRRQNGLIGMYRYQFPFRQTWSETPSFVCNADRHHLVSSFIIVLEGLATQSEAQVKLNFIEVEKAIRIELCSILEQLNQRYNRMEKANVR